MDTTSYENALTKERALLLEELASLGSIDHTIKGDWVSAAEAPQETEADDNLVADQAEEMISRSGELDALEARLAEVTRALEKIAAGTYGTCELCGQPIEAERLKANKAARTCKTHMDEAADLID